MEDLIKKFLSVEVCEGYGDGSGSGDGYSDGSGDGSGFGSGYSEGSGSGFGSGFGSCSGDGYSDGDDYDPGYDPGYSLMEYIGKKVWMVDGIPTIIASIHFNYALGKIINYDLTTTDCYIARVGNYFAHGKTLKEALADAEDKYESEKPIKDRIADFVSKYPAYDAIVEHSELYKWHHVLTGSCAFGRDAFAKDHNLDKEYGSMSVKAFIELTKNAYGGDVVKELAKYYE